MDVQMYLDRLELMWVQLGSYGFDSRAAREHLHRIGALEAEIKQRFHGFNTKVAQMRARGLLRYHLPQLMQSNRIDSTDVEKLHGMLRRLVMSKPPFHMRLQDESRQTDETATIRGILGEIWLLVENVDNPQLCRSRLHELVIELRAVVRSSNATTVKTVFVPWKDPTFVPTTDSAAS